MTVRQVGVDWDFLGNRLLNIASTTISNDAMLTPAVIAANVNNYNPTGYNDNILILRLTLSGNRNMTGIVAPTTNRLLILENYGGGNLTLQPNNAGSLAENRFSFSVNLVLNPSENCILRYDLTSQRWRIIAHAI